MSDPNEKIGVLHRGDITYMSQVMFSILFPDSMSLPAYYKKWLMDGFEGELLKAYQTVAYTRESMEDDT